MTDRQLCEFTPPHTHPWNANTPRHACPHMRDALADAHIVQGHPRFVHVCVRAHKQIPAARVLGTSSLAMFFRFGGPMRSGEEDASVLSWMPTL